MDREIFILTGSGKCPVHGLYRGDHCIKCEMDYLKHNYENRNLNYHRECKERLQQILERFSQWSPDVVEDYQI